MSLRETIRILVVDDMAASRGLITMGLDALGITNYDYLKDGETALKSLVANPCHLVISDYEMPKMNGLKLLEGLRVNATTRQIGFILISGRATPDILNKGRQLGMNNFLKKPFTTPKLQQCIEAVCGRLG
jgi:two-component system chemotaxis response regulator CheY